MDAKAHSVKELTYDPEVELLTSDSHMDVLASAEQSACEDLPGPAYTEDAESDSCFTATGDAIDSDDESPALIDMAKEDWLTTNIFISPLAQSSIPPKAAALTSPSDSDTDTPSVGSSTEVEELLLHAPRDDWLDRSTFTVHAGAKAYGAETVIITSLSDSEPELPSLRTSWDSDSIVVSSPEKKSDEDDSDSTALSQLPSGGMLTMRWDVLPSSSTRTRSLAGPPSCNFHQALAAQLPQGKFTEK